MLLVCAGCANCQCLFLFLGTNLVSDTWYLSTGTVKMVGRAQSFTFPYPFG